MVKFLVIALLFLANICQAAQLSYSIDELNLAEGESFTVPENAKKIAISKLIMQKGARILIPSNTSEFEFVIDSGTFLDDTAILSTGRKGNDILGVGQKGGNGYTGAHIIFKVNHAKFDFNATASKYFSIQSIGGTGGKGGIGSNGADAATSNCNSVPGNGHPAATGGQGAPGGDGGAGNEIIAYIRLIKNHPIITDKEIGLLSIGGEGGIGGDGGQGGKASPTVCCQRILGKCVVRRGGNSAAGPGSQGPQGGKGSASEVKLDLSYEAL